MLNRMGKQQGHAQAGNEHTRSSRRREQPDEGGAGWIGCLSWGQSALQLIEQGDLAVL
jgi:hypothetical protein